MSIVKDKVWLTAHARMIAEARLRARAWRWDILIVWYSTALTLLTVYQLVWSGGRSQEVLAALLAIGVLTLSIYIPNLGLRQKADSFRSCYLKLQRLLDMELEDQLLVEKYHDTLLEYPNHSNSDWNAFLVTSSQRGKPVEFGEKPIPVTSPMYVVYFGELIIFFVLWTVAYLAPVIGAALIGGLPV